MSDNDQERWLAVVARDQLFDGKFVYCVKTTKIFCRPICKARLARRANVEFHTTPAEAEAAGYRACKRCQPLLATYNPETDKVRKVCDILDNLPASERMPDLEYLAGKVNLTKHHFHRLFKRETGLTPRQYALSSRSQDNSSESTASAALSPVTPLEYDIQTPITNNDFVPVMDDGDFFNFDSIDPSLLEVQKDLSANIQSFLVFYNIMETTQGYLLVAFQDQKVCKLELGANEEQLLMNLEASFPSLYFVHSLVSMANEQLAIDFNQRIQTVVDALETKI